MMEAVIFDMDGVIIDSEPIHREVGMNTFQHLGLSVPDKLLDSFVGISAKQMWTKLKNIYNLQQSIEDLISMELDRYINYLDYLLMQKKIKPIPGVVELIKDLSKNKVKLALASSSSARNIDLVLKMFNLERFFAAKICGDDVSNGKPAPDIFIQTLKCIDVRAEDCFVIEDSRNGVKAAKSAGIKCIGFCNVNSRKQDLSCADIIIGNFLEIDYKKLCQFYNNIAMALSPLEGRDNLKDA